MANQGVHQFTMRTIDGKDKPLSDYKGKVLLIVNVASFCGNTPQYKELQELHVTYKERGLAVLGFPANEFAKEEPGTDAEIKAFCQKNYKVTFDMFSKIVAKGEGIHPLYKYLTVNSPYPGAIGWNFAKFLVDKNGTVVDRFSPESDPKDPAIVKKLEAQLKK